MIRKPIFPLALALLIGSTAVVRAADLEKQLVKHSAEVMKYLQDKGFKNVGVLKFIVKKDKKDGPASEFTDRIGPLNMSAADRLEMALVLANRPQNPIGIVRGASQVAAKTPGANHLTPEGRKKLFAPQYPLAWGNQLVAIDAFIVGSIELSADLKEMTVRLAAFGIDGRLDQVSKFTAAMGAENLAEAGESFVLRGVFDQGKVEEVALNDAKSVRESAPETPHPVKAAETPVDFQITYNGQPVPIETRGGKAFVREPREIDLVAFTLKRKDPTDTKRYAAVLKVNGENTLDRQKIRDLQCKKWVLEPKDPPIVVRGFQRGDNKAEAFRVMSKPESKAREIDYGEDVGLISLVVFKEKKGSEPPPADLPDDNAEDLAALTRGVFPAKPADNLSALQAQLRAEGRRGLLAGGQQIDSVTRTVTFDADPAPILAVTIVYFKP